MLCNVDGHLFDLVRPHSLSAQWPTEEYRSGSDLGLGLRYCSNMIITRHFMLHMLIIMLLKTDDKNWVKMHFANILHVGIGVLSSNVKVYV